MKKDSKGDVNGEGLGGNVCLREGEERIVKRGGEGL